MTWAARADAVIQQVHDQLPADADLATRKRELRRVASMFHGGTSWGKKVWSIRVRRYLQKHGLAPRSVADISPQSKLFERTKSGDIVFPFR